MKRILAITLAVVFMITSFVSVINANTYNRYGRYDRYDCYDQTTGYGHFTIDPKDRSGSIIQFGTVSIYDGGGLVAEKDRYPYEFCLKTNERYDITVKYGNGNRDYFTEDFNYAGSTITLSLSGYEEDYTRPKRFNVRVEDRSARIVVGAKIDVTDENGNLVPYNNGAFEIGPKDTFTVTVSKDGYILYERSFTTNDIIQGTLYVGLDLNPGNYKVPPAVFDTLKLAKELKECRGYKSADSKVQRNFEWAYDMVKKINDDFKDGNFQKGNLGYGYDSYRDGVYYVEGIPYTEYEFMKTFGYIPNTGYIKYKIEGDYYIVEGRRYTEEEFYNRFGYWPKQYYDGYDSYAEKWISDNYNALSIKFYVEQLIDAMKEVQNFVSSFDCSVASKTLSYPSKSQYNGFDQYGKDNDKRIDELKKLIDKAREVRDLRTDKNWEDMKKKINDAINDALNSLIGKANFEKALKNIKEVIEEAEKREGKYYIRPAYMRGRLEGYFEVFGNLKRSEVAQIIANLVSQSGKSIGPNVQKFVDVKDGAWYKTAVDLVSSNGIMTGFPGNKFNPDALVSKEELIVMAARLGGHTPIEANSLGIKGHKWSVPYIERAYQNKWFKWDESFKPNDKITRGQATQIINRAIGYYPDKDYIKENIKDMVQFSDLVSGNPYYYDVVLATNTIMYQELPNGTRIWKFNEKPNGKWTGGDNLGATKIKPLK